MSRRNLAILGVSTALFLALLFSATISPQTTPANAQRLGVFPTRADIARVNGEDSLYLSRDGLHTAAVVHAGEQFIVYTDGQPGPVYDAIGGLTLSPSGGHTAYAAKKGAQWFLVFDGNERAPCDGINVAWDYKPQYGPDGPHGGYSFGATSPDTALRFSDDGKHFVYAAQKGAKHFVVMDGQAGPEYNAVGGLVLSADGQHFAYLAKQGATQVAVIDGKAGPAYEGVGPLIVNRDGRHTAYVAYQAKKYFVVADGTAGPPFDFIGIDEFSLSGDGAHLGFAASVDHHDPRNYGTKRLVVVDGRAGPEYQGVRAPVFSADGRHVAYIAELLISSRPVEDKSCVVLDGQPGPQYTTIFSVQLSADGQHVAYLALDHQKYFVVFDGQPGSEYDLIARPNNTTAPILSPDGKRLAYEARIGLPGHDFHGAPIPNDTESAQPFIVVDGVPGPKYDSVYQLMFSPDSQHVAYRANKGGHWLAVLDGKEGPAYRQISGLTFSADGQHLAYVADKENGKTYSDRMTVVVDGREGPEFEQIILDRIGHEGPVFAADGSLRYLAARGGALYRVTQPLGR